MISATDPVSTLAIFAEMRVEPILFAIVLGTSILDDAIAKYLSKVMSKVYIEEIKSFLEIMAYLAESLVFFSIGMSIFNEELYNSYDFNTIAWSFLLCIIGRAAFVYPLSFLLNLRYDNNTIQPIATSSTTSMPIYTTRLEFNAQHMIVFAGLRGPISYAAALIFPDTLGHRGVVVATTRVIMLFTIFIKGGLTAFALSYFDIKRDYSSNSDDGDEILVDNLRM
eukprot:gene19586-25489_t